MMGLGNKLISEENNALGIFSTYIMHDNFEGNNNKLMK